MNKPENGLYMAMVSDDTVETMHADEDTIFDAQTDRIFSDRDRQVADQNLKYWQHIKEADKALRTEERLAAKRKRRRWYAVRDVLSLLCTAALVFLAYRFGLYIAIAAISGCLVAAGCRITNYFEKERMNYGCKEC